MIIAWGDAWCGGLELRGWDWNRKFQKIATTDGGSMELTPFPIFHHQHDPILPYPYKFHFPSNLQAPLTSCISWFEVFWNLLQVPHYWTFNWKLFIFPFTVDFDPRFHWCHKFYIVHTNAFLGRLLYKPYYLPNFRAWSFSSPAKFAYNSLVKLPISKSD